MSSFVTLFSLMVVNNWQFVSLMFEVASGYTWGSRLYFLLFYYIGVLIGYNVLIAFAIDIYASVKRLDEKT
jgi:uncharacterized integral membrane protein